MMNDKDFIRYIKKNANLFKKFTIAIPIFEKDYEFNITSITSNRIKLQYKFSYYSIASSDEGCVEYLIKNIITEDSRYAINDPFSLSQRARNRKNLRNTAFLAPIIDFEDEFIIKNFSQDYVTVEKSVEFADLENANEGSFQDIVKIQLYSFKEIVDGDIELNELERLEKEQRRLEKEMQYSDKNTVYTQVGLMHVALYKKNQLKWRSYFATKVHDSVCAFKIAGVGPQAVKLTKEFTIEDIYYSRENSVEGRIKQVIDDVLKDSYSDYDSFVREIDRHWLEFSYGINLLIGSKYADFKMIISSNDVKLEKYVRYEHMINKFNLGYDCLETILKRYIENFRLKIK